MYLVVRKLRGIISTLVGAYASAAEAEEANRAEIEALSRRLSTAADPAWEAKIAPQLCHVELFPGQPIGPLVPFVEGIPVDKAIEGVSDSPPPDDGPEEGPDVNDERPGADWDLRSSEAVG